MNAKPIRFADYHPTRRQPAGPRLRFTDSPADAGPVEGGGKTLVQTFPRGSYYLFTEYGGAVKLYRYDDPTSDLGNVGLGGPGSTEEAARGNLSKAAREGFAAAADAAAAVAKNKALNAKFADYYATRR